MELFGMRDPSSLNSVNDLLLQVFIILKNLSSNNYLVGGSVRDHLMGSAPKDYDIVTDVAMNELDQAFQEANWKVTNSGKAFLVLNVFKNHHQFEIANFRKDGHYQDGRRPESVEIGTIKEDAERRDFTVNALYMDPWDGRVLDPTNKGRKDLSSRTLRFIGDPRKRIAEDRLRIFRFYRFLTKGFVPDKKSLQMCRTMFNESYKLTAPERVREELEKMARL